MGKVIAFALGWLATLGSTYFGAAVIVFLLAGGWRNHPAGQQAVSKMNGAIGAFLAVAGPGFGDLVHIIMNSVSRAFGG